MGQPIQLSRAQAELRTASPEAGEHTNEILEQLGYGTTEIVDFRIRGAI